MSSRSDYFILVYHSSQGTAGLTWRFVRPYKDIPPLTNHARWCYRQHYVHHGSFRLTPSLLQPCLSSSPDVTASLLVSPPNNCECVRRHSKPREELVRKHEERAFICSHLIQKHSLFGGCLAFSSPFHLLPLLFALKQRKLIHSHLCRLTSLKFNWLGVIWWWW